MGVEVSFHLSCDVCHDYLAWAPSLTYAAALKLAKTLDWNVYDLTDSASKRWEYKAHVQCPSCWDKNVSRTE